MYIHSLGIGELELDCRNILGEWEFDGIGIDHLERRVEVGRAAMLAALKALRVGGGEGGGERCWII